MKKGNYEAAKTLGNAAGAKGMEALAALPATTAVDAKEIDDLKSRNKHELADSLANVKRLLDSTNFIEFMLAALQPLQSVNVVQIKPSLIYCSFKSRAFHQNESCLPCSLLYSMEYFRAREERQLRVKIVCRSH